MCVHLRFGHSRLQAALWPPLEFRPAGHRPEPSSPLWDLRSPHCPSHFPSQLQQPLQAGLLPRINYSQSPAAPALASMTQRGWLSHGGQRWLSTLLPMAPLRSLCTRSPAGTHPHDPWTVRGGNRDSPLFSSTMVCSITLIQRAVYSLAILFLIWFYVFGILPYLDDQTICFESCCPLFKHLAQL